MNLHYQQLGQGPALVLLHGWGMNSQIWTPLLAQLQQHYHLTLIDLPGMGGSHFMSYDINHLLPEFLKIAPVNATWLGWSLGGLLALQVAALVPEQVRSVILVASNPRFVTTTTWPGLSLATLQLFARQLALDPNELVKRFIATHLMQVADKQLVRQLQTNMTAAGTPTAAALAAGLHLLHHLDLRKVLQQLACPNLHIYGRLDAIVPLSVATQVAALNPRAEIKIIDKAGHIPFLSNMAVFIQMLRDFIC